MNKISSGFITIFILTAIHGVVPAEGIVFQPLPTMEYPPENPWSQEKQNLGEKLFFDPLLSGDNSTSCASCHKPEFGWTDGLKKARGFNKKELPRNTPTILNSGYAKRQYWDGRTVSLEEQAIIPILTPEEMNQTNDNLIQEINQQQEYVDSFRKVFGEGKITTEKISKAIATFERSLISGVSPYDRFWQGDKNALSRKAIKGMKLFFGKAKCSICHNGPLFTDQQFHNIGVLTTGATDLGRHKITQEPFHKGAFKTPGLRDISLTGPYMHNGSLSTLEEVIEFYDQGGQSNVNKSPFITSIGLNTREKKSLVEFLKSLISDSSKYNKAPNNN
jgi:cytochrome c peroxidase